MHSLSKLLSITAITILATPTINAVAQKSYAEPSRNAQDSAFSKWWHGKTMTGDWLGVRNELQDHGLALNGKYYGAYFGVVDSAGGSRGFWDQGIEFGADLNFGKLLKVEALEGMKGFAGVRWRDNRLAANPNEFVEASSMFNPSNWISGMQWRLTSFGIEYKTGELFAVKDLFTIKGGWLQPQREFIDQPLSKLFLNNAVNSAKGIGGNIPFSSSFSTWGATLQIKPVEWHYAKAALFMAYPQATSSGNHGIAMQGFAPNRGLNGLMAMAETGITPTFGSSELPGKYAVGGYYWGNDQNSFNGTNQYGQYGFYWQADQMLFREREAAIEGEVLSDKGATQDSRSADAKSFKTPISSVEPRLSEQGLRAFNLVTFAPKYNNTYPFYFQSGLVYQGLLPGRDKDQTMFSLAYGNYSYYSNLARRESGSAWQNYTMFLEWGYRFEMNGWSFVQPFAQYVIRPNGTDAVQNATILGIYTGLTF